MRKRQSPGLRDQVLFGFLDRVTGHSKPLESVPSHRRPTIGSPTHSRRLTYEPPPPLPAPLPRRKRLLTPASSRSASPEPFLYDEQFQSVLLQRLPEEILMLIYEYVIGKRVIHLVRRKDHLGHMKCLSNGDPDACRELQCRGMKLPNGLYVASGHGNGGGLIQLLQSCRKMYDCPVPCLVCTDSCRYATAIKAMYGSNVLDFDSMESVVAFSTVILPQRFDAIQSLQLDFRFSLSAYACESTPSNDQARWVRTWQVIGSIKALKNLWVRISWSHNKMSAAQEKVILEPLWMASRLRTYEVSLPPAYAGKEVDWEDAPFTVTRRGS